jgi:hypothetical protein
MGTGFLQIQTAETENSSRNPVSISENMYIPTYTYVSVCVCVCVCVCLGVWNVIDCSDRCVLWSQYICLWSHLTEKLTISNEMSLHLPTWLLITRTQLPQDCSRSRLVWGQLGSGVPRGVQTSHPPEIPKFWRSWVEIVLQYQKLRKFCYLKWNFLYQITAASRTPDWICSIANAARCRRIVRPCHKSSLRAVHARIKFFVLSLFIIFHFICVTRRCVMLVIPSAYVVYMV